MTYNRGSFSWHVWVQFSVNACHALASGRPLWLLSSCSCMIWAGIGVSLCLCLLYAQVLVFQTVHSCTEIQGYVCGVLSIFMSLQGCHHKAFGLMRTYVWLSLTRLAAFFYSEMWRWPGGCSPPAHTRSGLGSEDPLEGRQGWWASANCGQEQCSERGSCHPMEQKKRHNSELLMRKCKKEAGRRTGCGSWARQRKSLITLWHLESLSSVPVAVGRALALH